MHECTCCHQVKDESEFYTTTNRSWCKDCVRAKRAEYRRLHPDRVKASKKASYEKHRDKWLAYYDQWRSANYEQYRENIRQWNREHPAALNEYSQTHRARKLGASVCDFTVEQWEAVKKAYGGRCVYCGKKGRKLTQDHVIPLSRGGNHTMDNIVPACQSCNASKHARTPEEAGYTLQRKMAAVYQEA